MHSEPETAATLPPLEAPTAAEILPPGVRKSKQHSHRLAPYEISLYEGSKRVSREYFDTPIDAAKALEKHRKKQRKHGTGVFKYDAAQHHEYSEAKDIAGGADLRVVARFYADRHKGAGAAPTVRAASHAYRATKEKLGRSDDHTATIKSRLEEFCTVFGERPIDTVTTNEILDWILDLKKSDGEPVSPRTKFNFYTELYGLFAFAKKRKWIMANPVEDIDREADLPTVPRGLKGKLTVPQGVAFLRLFENGRRVRWIYWALVQYFVGVRDAEAGRMHGEWIDPQERKIKLPGWHLEGKEIAPVTKTRDDWVIDDIPEAFWEWIRRYPPPKGRLTAGGVVYALDGVSAPDDGKLRRIARHYVEANGTLTQVGRDELSADEDGRHALRRIYIQLASAGYVQCTIGSTTTSGSVNLVQSREEKSESEAVRRVVRLYIEATTTLAEIGYPDYSRADDNRKVIAREFIIAPLSAGAEPVALQGAIGVEVFDGCVCADAQAEQKLAYVLIRKRYIEATGTLTQIGRDALTTDADIRRVVREYIQATDTLTQIGGAEARPAGERAYVGTSAGAIISSTRLAREWVLRYLIRGDATASDGAWLAINTSLAFGARTGYLTETYAERKGTAYTVIARVFTEKPDDLVYPRSDLYTFPGVIGWAGSGGGVFVAQDSVTRQTALEIEETYHIGQVSPLAPEFEVTAWAKGTIVFTPAATGIARREVVTFPGCLGSVTFSGSNTYYKSVLCSSQSINGVRPEWH